MHGMAEAVFVLHEGVSWAEFTIMPEWCRRRQWVAQACRKLPHMNTQRASP
jgi:hypothetical protein